MLISPAFAQAAGGAAGGGDLLTGILPFVFIFVIFYFLLIRPQQKKMKQHQEMVKSLRRGDKVVTGGGLIGTVSKVVSDTEIEVELAANVKVRVMRNAVSDVVSKTEPVAGAKSDDEPAEQPAADAADGEKKASGLGKLLGKDKK